MDYHTGDGVTGTPNRDVNRGIGSSVRAFFQFLWMMFFSIGALLALISQQSATAAVKSAAPDSDVTPLEPPSSIGKFDTWTAYTMPDGPKLMCYALSSPTSTRDNAKRAKAYLMVTHRPAEKTLNVVSISLGYHTAANGSAAVTLGSLKFDFFTRDQTAWSRDSDTDKAVVTAMRKNEQLVIKAKADNSVTGTEDTYSLIGFPAALDAIDKACKVKR